jgi:hypothetical protein
MKTILAIFAALALATAAHAETEALVTDTNNQVISGRAGALTFTNILRPPSISWAAGETLDATGWTSGEYDRGFNFETGVMSGEWSFSSAPTISTLTNATGPTLVLADTNGTLTTGSVPSGGAPEGAVLTVVGGQYAGVASKVQFAIKPTNQSRASWTNNSFVDAAANRDPNLEVTLEAGRAYRLEWNMTFSDTGNVSYNLFGLPVTSGRRAFGLAINVSGTAIQVAQGASNQSYLTPPAIIAGANTGWQYWGYVDVAPGTNSTTVYVAWWPTNNVTNVSTLLSNSWLRATRLD